MTPVYMKLDSIQKAAPAGVRCRETWLSKVANRELRGNELPPSKHWPRSDLILTFITTEHQQSLTRPRLGGQ